MPPRSALTASAKIQNILDAFQNSRSPQETAALLETLQHEFSAATTAEAVAALRAFLHSGKDTATHRPFKLNPDGSLSDAPTLRVLLLDKLITLDKGAAAQCAREILAAPTSADEWAVALRAVALADGSDSTRAFLAAKAQEMAQYQPWQTNPSTGYLEAFDVFVYTHDTDFVPALSDFAGQTNNPALAHAAFLTLDRLVQEDPLVTLQSLLGQPGLLAARGATAAGYFARADSGDPSQQRLLEDYLLSPSRTLPELEAFAGVFPNEIFLVSNNLLTQNPAPPASQILDRLNAASNLIGQWQADPRFQSLLPQLAQIQNRISRIRGG